MNKDVAVMIQDAKTLINNNIPGIREELSEQVQKTEDNAYEAIMTGQSLTELEINNIISGQRATDMEIELILQGTFLTGLELQVLEMKKEGNQ